MALVEIDSKLLELGTSEQARRGREYCLALERGDILFFPRTPVALRDSDLQFLRSQRQSGAGYHKNIAYRPLENRLTGYAGEDSDQMRAVMERFSSSAMEILSHVLRPYFEIKGGGAEGQKGRTEARGGVDPDFASFRPIEEHGRAAKLHARNDLLHVDSFPTRPTHGRRILRFFVNIHPAVNRVWKTGPAFPELARSYAASSGLLEAAQHAGFTTRVMSAAGKLGLPVKTRPAYDRFMLSFHHWLKENRDFQSATGHSQWSFPPMSSWMVFTDTVSHAVLSGQYALEQTVLVRRDALVAPDLAPVSVMEQLGVRD